MGAELETGAGPGVEVVLHVDGAAGALLLADGPVLVEGGGAIDGGLVDALGAVDVVDTAVRGDGPETGGARARVVGAEVLDDVVLYERVASPAVDGEVRVAVGGVGAGVVDGAIVNKLVHGSSEARTPPRSGRRRQAKKENIPISTGHPTLSTDPVTVAGPLGAVLATSLVGVLNAALVVSPEGEVVAVVGASGRRGVGLTLEEAALAGELAGEGEDARDGRGGDEEDGGESNHFDGVDLRLSGKEVLRMRNQKLSVDHGEGT